MFLAHVAGPSSSMIAVISSNNLGAIDSYIYKLLPIKAVLYTGMILVQCKMYGLLLAMEHARRWATSWHSENQVKHYVLRHGGLTVSATR